MNRIDIFFYSLLVITLVLVLSLNLLGVLENMESAQEIFWNISSVFIVIALVYSLNKIKLFTKALVSV